MFSSFTKELPSSWEEEEVQLWKKKALDIQKTYYLSFAGSQGDAYDWPGDKLLLRSKICYAMFGLPAKEEDNIEELYEANQHKRAEAIIEQILKIAPPKPKVIKVGFIFIACKEEEKEYVLPIFRVLKRSDKNANDQSGYVDTHNRTYDSWEDWKNKNNLPMMKYAYPKNGYYTSRDGVYVFDSEKDPVIEYGTSPSCDLSSRIFRVTDSVSGLVSLGSAGIAVAAMFTPLAPAVLLGSAIAGGSSAIYGGTRVVNRLVDKGTHGESLADLESITLWIILAATPLNFVTSAVNNALYAGAAEGRILSSSFRTFATIINFTTLGVDTVMLGFGLANLIEKARNDQLDLLDVAQFSMSVFFFTNTLIQPKVASQIIAKAQEQHITRYMNSMTDQDAQASLNKFVETNRGDNTITSTSKIIRTINRIEDPNGFFKGVGDAQSVQIGGRKGRTVLVTDSQGNTNRINPNRVMLNSQNQGGQVKRFTPVSKKLEESFGKDLKEVELNGKKVFKNLSEREKGALRQAVEATARKDNNVISAAFEVAESLGCRNADEFASVIEIVAADIGRPEVTDRTARLNEIRTGKEAFVNDFKNDLASARNIADSANLKLADPYKAVYHYRKHGNDFPTKSVDKIQFYLDSVPDKLIRDNNLREILTLKDNTTGGNTAIRKIYLSPNDSMAVVTETESGRIISTMFKKPESYKTFIQKLQKNNSNTGYPGAVKEMIERLAMSRSLLSMLIYIGIQNQEPKLINLEDGLVLDSEMHREIARLLCAMAESSEEI